MQTDIFIKGVPPTQKDSEYSLLTSSCEHSLERRSLLDVRSENQKERFFLFAKLRFSHVNVGGRCIDSNRCALMGVKFHNFNITQEPVIPVGVSDTQ